VTPLNQNSQVIDAKANETVSHDKPTGQSAQSPSASMERKVNAEQERDLEAKKVITALLEKLRTISSLPDEMKFLRCCGRTVMFCR
jgi:uncharacterized protein with WD repeat